MENTFTVENTINFTPAVSMYYKGTDIMEYCWRRLACCDDVDIPEILADDKNITIPKGMTIGRFMEIINSLRMQGADNDSASCTPEDCDDMSMDAIFGEDDTDKDYDESVEWAPGEMETFDDCCCKAHNYFSDLFPDYITLADFNSFLGTLYLKSDNSAGFDFEPFNANDSLNRMLDSYDFNFDTDNDTDCENDCDSELENDLLNDYVL